VAKMQKVHCNSRIGKWTVLREDGAVMCHGSKQNIEDFLDLKQNADAETERKRKARIHRRMCELLNWLYNNKKGR